MGAVEFRTMEPDLPLFVLPMVLFPGEVQELRVFEPRYRQMLDTCVLDERPFGLVNSDPFNPVNGWDGPRTHGCEAIITHHETRGMNHFITVRGGRKFRVDRVIEPVLPPFSDPSMTDFVNEDGALADVEQLIDHVGPDHEHHRLYISAEVTYLPEDTTALSEDQQGLLRDTVSEVLNQVGAGMNIQEAVLTGWVNDFCEEHLDGTAQSVYHVASLLLNTTEARQLVLDADTVAEAMEELHLHVNPLGLEEE